MPRNKKTRIAPVSTRRVVHISGFEPVSPSRLERRMDSGLRHFAPVWGADSIVAPAEVSADGRSMTWTATTSGANWTTKCRYSILRWDDLMAPYVERSWLGRILHGYKALGEFVFTGTMRRYFKANLRYGLFAIYPLLLLVGFLLLAIAAATVAVAVGVPYSALVGPIIGVVIFVLLLRFLGGYFFLDFALADWAFAADLCRRDVSGLDGILDQFADEVVDAMRDPEADEVLLSGVSLGAVMMVEALARAFARTPGLDKDARRTALLTVGSSIMKIGLHPAAAELRRVVHRIGAERSLLWAEYQAKVDPINFYRTDPVADLGNPKTGSPVVTMIHIRKMMSEEGYRRAQRSSLHLHRQFVKPNAKRYFYDFYHIGFGPLRLADRLNLNNKVTAIFSDGGGIKPSRLKRRCRDAAPMGE
ncbi:MAG: hypothetical protein GY798_19125 [Hyphomicrobiales bacterium]|nr:hypothetical protein [Hyphomicrobiales bacterium]